MIASATGSGTTQFGGTHCIVSDTGNVLWVPPAQLVALCQFDLQYWPFDTQYCYLKFGSWTYHGEEINLQISKNRIDVSLVLTKPPLPQKVKCIVATKQLSDQLIPNGEWEITYTNVSRHLKYYACCNEPYVDITFDLKLNRRSATYQAIIITPALCKFSVFISDY